MIYLRPSRRITSPGEGDPLLAGIDILDEYMRGLQRAHTPFTLVIESEHGSDLDEDGVRETVLHLRIYGHDGNDLTDLLPADFAPEWYQGDTQVGVGMSLALTWQDVKTYSTTYSVTLTAWRIYEALATQEPVEPGIQRLLSEISCRGEFILQGSIRLVNDRLEFIVSDLSSAKSELEKKLDASDFNSFKADDFKRASDRLASAESSLKSHASELQKKLDASDFNSFKADDFKRASDRLASAESSLKSQASELQKKLDTSAFDSFKAGDFKTASDRLASAESTLSSHTSELQKKLDTSDFNSFKAGDFKRASDRLTSAERAISSHTSELQKKLDASDFNSFKADDFKRASDRLASAESSLKSHASELQKKLDASDFNSFKADDFKTASDRLTSAESSLKSQASELQKKLDTSAFVRLQSRIGEITAGKTLAEQVRELPTSSKVSEMLHDRDRNTYTVRVFTTGQIRNGKMDVANPTDPITQQPAVLHSALASNLLSGQAAADFYHSLKWTVNKGRTSTPRERTVTGSRCYVLARDIVTPSDGSAPYYDIQLERLT